MIEIYYKDSYGYSVTYLILKVNTRTFKLYYSGTKLSVNSGFGIINNNDYDIITNANVDIIDNAILRRVAEKLLNLTSDTIYI